MCKCTAPGLESALEGTGMGMHSLKRGERVASGHTCLQGFTAVAQQEAKSPGDSESPELPAEWEENETGWRQGQIFTRTQSAQHVR